MAIIGITPTFMSPIAYRNFAPELEQQTRSNAAGLRQLADFATKAYDYNKNRQIGDALKRGNVNEAAELESQKINQQDPAVLWRWKEGQNLQKAQIDAANAQRAADEEKAKQNLMNETKSLLNNVVTKNPEAMTQYINNLQTQKAKLENMGVDTTPIDNKITELKSSLEGINADLATQNAEAMRQKKIQERISSMKQFLTAESMKKYFMDHLADFGDDEDAKFLAIDLIHDKRVKELEDEENKKWDKYNKGRQFKANQKVDEGEAFVEDLYEGGKK